MTTAYEVHYLDKQGRRRCWCTYGRDALAVKHSAEEMLQSGYRITRILPTSNFDW